MSAPINHQPSDRRRTNTIILAVIGITLAVVCVICTIGAALSRDDEPAVSGRIAGEGTTTSVTEQPAEPEPTEAVEEPEPPETPALTVSQQNAIESAQSYLSFTAFSRQGLIDQLVFEQYSVEDATFAVDYLNVDWNEQAAKSAQSYLEFTSFSRQGLIDQLIFEGFTPEQAEYGVNAVGL